MSCRWGHTSVVLEAGATSFWGFGKGVLSQGRDYSIEEVEGQRMSGTCYWGHVFRRELKRKGRDKSKSLDFSNI